MKKLIYVFFFWTATFAFAQINQEKTYMEVEQIPDFPDGGANNFRKILASNFKIKNVKAKGRETCVLNFVIDREGSIVDVKAIGNNQSFNKEAIAAITKIKTKWIPAKLKNETIRYRMRVPLTVTFN